MGGGHWDASTYASTTRSKIDSGTSFSYTKSTSSFSRADWKAHEDLDPKKVNGPASPLAGQNIRESRDNDEHPNSTPIQVYFDQTGSMGNVPRVIQTKLAGLFGLLLRKGYCEDPQVLVGAYGDAHVDQVPLQASQFESDNRIDDNLDKLFLEGGGGGNFGESMNLAWYFAAYHTATDSFEKRGKKGYAFFIGDERCIDLTAADVKKYADDGQPLGSLNNKDLVTALLDKWDAYVLLIDNMTAKQQRSEMFYKDLFGADRVLVVQDEAAIAETIALAIGVAEGTIDLDEGADDLRAEGSDAKSIEAATKALAVRGSRRLGQVVISDAPADLIPTDDDSVTRL